MFYFFNFYIIIGHGTPRNISENLKTAVAFISDGLFLVISQQLLDAISCDYTDPSTPVLYVDPSIVCWEGEHAPLAAISLVCYAFYVPLSIMISPMLLQPGPGDEQGVSFTKLYLMVDSVLKSVMLLAAALGPKTVATVVTSTIINSAILATITLRWFLSNNPSAFKKVSIQLEPCNIAFVNLAKSASYTSGVVSAIVVIIAHNLGPKAFTPNHLLICLVVLWACIIIIFGVINNFWTSHYRNRYAGLDKLVTHPFKWRDFKMKMIQKTADVIRLNDEDEEDDDCNNDDERDLGKKKKSSVKKSAKEMDEKEKDVYFRFPPTVINSDNLDITRATQVFYCTNVHNVDLSLLCLGQKYGYGGASMNSNAKFHKFQTPEKFPMYFSEINSDVSEEDYKRSFARMKDMLQYSVVDIISTYDKSSLFL